MILYPAIDLYEGKAVRLLRGDYAQMTVYNENGAAVAADFVRCGARRIHIVDLAGARDGGTPNFETVCAIKRESGAFCEVGGGVRDLATVERYLGAGLDRVILGTAAVRDPVFLERAVTRWGEKIAVGVDLRDGFVAVKGWTERSELEAFAFCERLAALGVGAVICTDISRDGAMQGPNLPLYRRLAERFSMELIASGGVSSLDDLRDLRAAGLSGAIIGKAYYTGALDLKEAIEVIEA